MTVKKFDTALIVGRFQHIHKGHESMIDIAIDLADRVVIFLGSAQEYRTKRNPFDVTLRKKLIEEIYGDKVIVIPLNDMSSNPEEDIDGNWGRYLLNHFDKVMYKSPELMVYGNDKSRSLWFDEEDIVNTNEFIVNRGKINISATEIRRLMVIDDRKEWMNWVNPKLHKHYDELRNILMSISEYQEMYKEEMIKTLR